MIAAIVPAAGLSTRMGCPKLLLEIRGTPLIVRVVKALFDGGADRVVVVVGPPTQAGAIEAAKFAREAGAVVEMLDEPTPDMRSTIHRGLNRLESDPPQSVLIVPGDSVGISSNLVVRMIAASRLDPTRILVPGGEGKGGHPLVLPWTEALSIRDLPPSVGVNSLLRNRSTIVDRIEVEGTDHAADLDTPEDYARWSGS